MKQSSYPFWQPPIGSQLSRHHLTVLLRFSAAPLRLPLPAAAAQIFAKFPAL
jgi:hypothetical protein